MGGGVKNTGWGGPRSAHLPDQEVRLCHPPPATCFKQVVQEEGDLQARYVLAFPSVKDVQVLERPACLNVVL